jgi:hypothetical protein
VHLSLLESHRQLQLQLLCQLLESLPEDAPVIIVGDFNDWQLQGNVALARRITCTKRSNATMAVRPRPIQRVFHCAPGPHLPAQCQQPRPADPRQQTVDAFVGPPAIGGGSAPVILLRNDPRITENACGSRLPATADQATEMLNVPTSSRTSPLSQG